MKEKFNELLFWFGAAVKVTNILVWFYFFSEIIINVEVLLRWKGAQLTI